MAIDGFVAQGFEPVRDAFARTLADRRELGAACAAYRGDDRLVDLWGGHRDRARRHPWRADTMVLVCSTTKGVAGLTVALAHARRLFDYHERVCTYWPEFARSGKESITIFQLLSHQAGLPALDERIDAGVMANLDRMAAILARQRPVWTPGTRHGYHALSLGWYENELIRRVDPRHRSLGRFFQEELARPLGLDFHIGLPESVPEERIAEIASFTPFGMATHLYVMPARMVLAYLWPGSLVARTMGNPRLGSPGDMNLPQYRRVEWPAAAGIGTVRSIARAYAAFACGGSELGVDGSTLTVLETAAPRPALGFRDEILTVRTRYSAGFMKPSPAFTFGSSERAYGTIGTGGSFGCADPDTGVGYAYAPSRHGFRLWDDPRELSVRRALFDCLSRGYRGSIRGGGDR